MCSRADRRVPTAGRCPCSACAQRRMRCRRARAQRAPRAAAAMATAWGTGTLRRRGSRSCTPRHVSESPPSRPCVRLRPLVPVIPCLCCHDHRRHAVARCIRCLAVWCHGIAGTRSEGVVRRAQLARIALHAWQLGNGGLCADTRQVYTANRFCCVPTTVAPTLLTLRAAVARHKYSGAARAPTAKVAKREDNQSTPINHTALRQLLLLLQQQNKLQLVARAIF